MTSPSIDPEKVEELAAKAEDPSGELVRWHSLPIGSLFSFIDDLVVHPVGLCRKVSENDFAFFGDEKNDEVYAGVKTMRFGNGRVVKYNWPLHAARLVEAERELAAFQSRGEYDVGYEHGINAAIWVVRQVLDGDYSNGVPSEPWASVKRRLIEIAAANERVKRLESLFRKADTFCDIIGYVGGEYRPNHCPDGDERAMAHELRATFYTERQESPQEKPE